MNSECYDKPKRLFFACVIDDVIDRVHGRQPLTTGGTVTGGGHYFVTRFVHRSCRHKNIGRNPADGMDRKASIRKQSGRRLDTC